MEICTICMEIVFLPVEIICFDCFKENQISCSSFTRCCRKCAHNFLQLDTDSFEREFVKRCFFCPGLTHPRFLNHSNAYRKDFILMKQDMNIYQCIYCNQVQGTQIVIDRHLDLDCLKVPMQWSCGHITTREEKLGHVKFCRYHSKCHYCEDYFSSQELKAHLFNDHNLLECLLCKTIVPRLLMSHHMSFQCPERKENCEICQEEFKHEDIYQHYDIHLKKVETELFLCKRQLVKLMRDYRKIRSLLQSNSLMIT